MKNANDTEAFFSKTFIMEVVLSLQHQQLVRLDEDSDDTSFPCALSGAFLPMLPSMSISGAHLTANSLSLSVHYQFDLAFVSALSQGRGSDGGGGGFLQNLPQYVSSGNGCWELELNLWPDRYGNHTYFVEVSVESLSGLRSVSFDIQIVVDQVNDMPSFALPYSEILVEENQFVQFEYVRYEAATNISAGPFEPLQQISFELAYVSGDRGLFAEGPVITANGTMIFRLQVWQRGSAEYSVMLVDERAGTNSSLVDFLVLHVRAIDHIPSFNRTSAVGVGWDLAPMVEWTKRERWPSSWQCLCQLNATCQNSCVRKCVALNMLSECVPGCVSDSNVSCSGTGSVFVRESYTYPIALRHFIIDITAGVPSDALEKLQNISFRLELISGDPSLFAEPPQVAPDGTLRLRLHPFRHGYLQYNLTLADDFCSGGEHSCANSTCDTCAADCFQIAASKDRYAACTANCDSDDVCNTNAEVVNAKCGADTYLRETRFDTCLGETASIPQVVWINVLPVNDVPSFAIQDTLQVLETHSSDPEDQSHPNFASNITAGPLELHQNLTFSVEPMLARVPAHSSWSQDLDSTFAMLFDTNASSGGESAHLAREGSLD